MSAFRPDAPRPSTPPAGPGVAALPPLHGRLEPSSHGLPHHALEAFLASRGIVTRRLATRFGSLRVLCVPRSASGRGREPPPPMVMLHGFASSAFSMLSLALSLDGARDCFLFDLFDFAGDSRRYVSPFGTAPLRVREHAAAVAEGITALALASYDLYGVSFGAWIGLHVASDAAARGPARMFLVNPLGTRSDVARLRALAERAKSEGLDETARALFGEGSFARLPLARSAMRALLAATLRVGRSRELAASLDESDAVDPILALVRAEVTLLAGETDALVGSAGVTAIHAGLARVRGEWALGQGHDLPVTCAGLVTTRLRAFVGAPCEAAPGGWARARLHVSALPRTAAMVIGS